MWRRRMALRGGGCLAALAAFALLAVGGGASTAHSAVAAEAVTIDGNDAGRQFDGVGGLSASSSRLLIDYPEPERSQILDYLFKPNYGASLQILKVEIGGETNSTSGAEPSHMRTPDEVDCDRGFEWWLMHEAKQRNPDIELYGLLWGAPGWVEMWSQDHVDYLVEWLRCAEGQGLRIDYLGGANETNAAHRHADFFVALDQALETSFPHVQIVAGDEHTPSDYWRVATAMTQDAAFRDAVDIVGSHTICGWRTPYLHCGSSEDALSLDKPLWMSEQSSQDADSGGAPLARAMTRSYIDARTTANINWSMMAGFYSTVRTAGTGLMLAQTPWSGYYKLGPGIWVDAHATQFTEPGWRYLDGATGYLDSGASFVTLRSPDTGDYSVIVETTEATGPTDLDLAVAGGLSHGDVHVWSTDVNSLDSEDWFVKTAITTPEDGRYSVRLEPGRLYTLSTTTGQHKGTAAPTDPDAGPHTRLSLPYREGFETIRPSGTVPYFADLEGAFETAPCGGGRDGSCYRQVITQKPTCWHCGTLPDMPTTVMGDPQWQGDYQVSVDAMLEENGWVELVGRSETHTRQTYPGYHLRVQDDGAWRLYAEDAYGMEDTLASGTTPMGVGSWHRLALRFAGDRVTVLVDDRELARVDDRGHTSGMIGLGVSPYRRAQFDDLSITPTRLPAQFVPQSEMTATATSSHAGIFDHHLYPPDRAIDGRPETMWGSEWDPLAPLPQSITLDLGQTRRVWGLSYQPRLDTYRNTNRGTITGYNVYVSEDGERYTKVSSGDWPVSTATRTDAWTRGHVARYVRLEATSAVDGFAVIGELNVLSRPAPASASSRG